MRPSLAHDAQPEAYAESMTRCQMYAPACSDAGECALEGWCFGKDGTGYAAARKMVASLISSERDVFVRAWLKVALDGIDDHQFCGRKALDAMKLIQISKRVRREYEQAHY